MSYLLSCGVALGPKAVLNTKSTINTTTTYNLTQRFCLFSLLIHTFTIFYMASYMYMSATGHNWDDDEDDENFEFGSCTAVIQSSAAPAIHNSKEYCVADHHTSPFPSMPTNDNVERTFDTASYMYISPTGRNWDDNDEEEVFDLEAFTQSTMHVLDDLAPLQLETAVSEEFESESELEQFVSPAPIESTIYKTIESDFWPSYAQKMTERWFYSDSCPAYTELSHDGNDYFPEVRVQYTANWTATKLRMGSNIRNPIMMRPSPLRLSKTWVQDSLGEYVEDRGSLFPSMPSPGLGYDSTSDEEHDEACTPPGSPLRAQDKECEIEIEEVSDWSDMCDWDPANLFKYDPTTGAIDLSMQNMDAMEVNLLQEFEAFSAVAEDLDFEDILGITASKLGHVRDGELQIWDDQSGECSR